MDDTDADAVDLYEELGLSDWPDVLDREAALEHQDWATRALVGGSPAA
jgi:hypothetical protein